LVLNSPHKKNGKSRALNFTRKSSLIRQLSASGLQVIAN